MPYSAPGVYVEEIPTFPPSVAEVSTAVPAFIGYTANGETLPPTRIQTMKDYEQFFGGAPDAITSVTVSKDAKGQVTSITPTLAADIPFLYYSLRLYFDNGGGPCYIVSAGNHSDTVELGDNKSGIKGALAALQREDEPTLIVMPDATRLAKENFPAACGAALDHCGTMKDRFAILDVKKGQEAADFRAVSSDYLKYGAAYTPYLNTALAYLYDETKVKVEMAATVGGIKVTYPWSSKKPEVEIIAGTNQPPFSIDSSNADSPRLIIQLKDAQPAASADVVAAWTAWKNLDPKNPAGFDITKDSNKTVGATAATSLATRTLSDYKATDTALYNQVKTALGAERATLPPSGAVAGVYARVDRDRGVWKAPANVAVASVISLNQSFTDEEQGAWNVDPTSGKSINIIRSFTGRGTLVWGARTLAGNDNEWRYVPVRRLFIMIEESAQKSTAFAVFEPNTAETWLKVKAMIESFLYGLWERGALAGSKPEAAYFVNVGLGSTMTRQDILEGRMIVEIGVAAVRPAEFIILRFSHKMQEA